MAQPLSQLKTLLDGMLADVASKEDVANIIKAILEAVRQWRDVHSEQVKGLKKDVETLTKAEESKRSELEKSLVGDVRKSRLEIDSELAKLRSELKVLGAEIVSKIPPETDLSEIVDSINELKSSALKLIDVENQLPQFGQKYRDALELLQGDDRLDKSAIKGLEEELKRIEETKSAVVGGGTPRMRVQVVDLSSQCNGVLKTFGVPLNFGILGVWGSQYPVNLRPQIDWTEGNKTLTLTSEVGAPQTGQTLWCQILK